jgi:hypothetical protein
VSLKEKKKEFRFTFQNLLRLLVFFLIVFILITFFSSKEKADKSLNDPTVLGEETATPSAQLQVKNITDDLYQKIPPKSRQQLENLNQNPVIISIQEKFQELQKAANGFPDKQIKEIKKSIVKSIYEDMMRNIDKQ